MKTYSVTMIAVVATIACAACRTRPPVSAPTHALRGPGLSTAPAATTAPLSAPSAHPLPSEDIFERESLNELNAQHPLGDAFFDYNQTTLRDDARVALQQDAAWLAKQPGTRIRIEGHCDERGTAEYNLALGERRAQQISQYLQSLGVDADRIEIETLGKEAPFCTQARESCWALNRRGHFVITAK